MSILSRCFFIYISRFSPGEARKLYSPSHRTVINANKLTEKLTESPMISVICIANGKRTISAVKPLSIYYGVSNTGESSGCYLKCKENEVEKFYRIRCVISDEQLE